MTRRNRSTKQAKAVRRRAAARTRLRRDPLLAGRGAEQWAAEAERLGRDWAVPGPEVNHAGGARERAERSPV
jgi:hypothetical protein